MSRKMKEKKIFEKQFLITNNFDLTQNFAFILTPKEPEADVKIPLTIKSSPEKILTLLTLARPNYTV